MEAIKGDVRTRKPIRGAAKKTELLDSDTAVSWIMTRKVVSVRPDVLLTSLEALFVTQDLSRVPVIDGGGLLMGVVSKTDLMTHHLEEGDAVERLPMRMPGRQGTSRTVPAGFHSDAESGDTVADVMCQTVLTVTQQMTIARAAELMAVHRVHGLPVVAPGSKVIGWISALDILSWLAGVTK